MKRVPFGISSAPEIFIRTVSEILKGIDGVICYFDDILCYSKTKEEHENLIAQVQRRLREASLQLNEAKCEYRKSEIIFLGHVIDAKGCRPDPRKVEAIRDMPEPRDTTELRRYLGMVNYLCRYMPHLSTVSKPLNLLLMKDMAWTWGPEQTESFKKIREMLTTAPLLAYFDPSRPTVVEADSSSYGIGGCLLQEFDDGLKPIAYCSRTLTNAEQKYAQIEKECLASVWACERFERYLMGLDSFILLTDHKPLVPLINSKDLSETPIRCQRMLIRLMRYKPTAEYRPGPTMVTSDTLSRCPTSTSSRTLEVEQNLQNDIRFHVDVITSTWPITDEKLKEIKAKTQEDPILKTAFEYTTSGWPMYKEDIKLAARELYGVRNELSVVDGLLLRGDPVLIKLDGEKGWKQPGVIMNECAPRSYNVQTIGEVRRNRRHLRFCPSGYQHPHEFMPDNTATEQPEFLPVPETSQNSESEVQPAQPLQVPTDSNPSSSTMRGVPGSPSLPYVTRSGRAVTKPSRYRE
ncbi:Pol polyprotein [Plakobranchus ocellatus]|uniref:Pol polyprotein n=2 Tax=Plakobranchus ocellatus TaxID=259542 RepID=A0AAV3ZX10_9GAST|nr:Pol polyprotein [Plakobranchus ocellatus]